MVQLRGAVAVAVVFCAGQWCFGAGPFQFVRSVPLTGLASNFFPLYYDYNGNGTDDVMQVNNNGTFQLYDGQSGNVLRTWTAGYESYYSTCIPIPDSTGDGEPEFLVGVPDYNGRLGAVFAIPSQSPGGTISGNMVGSMPLVYSINAPDSTGGFGDSLATTTGPNPTALIGWSSAGKAMLINATTGAVQARLARSTAAFQSGFSMGIGAVGDITGNGVQDFAICDPNVNNGEMYLVSSKVTTAGSSFVAVNALTPATGLIATLHTTTAMSLGTGPVINLGDPDPTPGVRHQLLVAGTPYASNGEGGFAAFLVTTIGSTTTYSQVASFISNNSIAGYVGQNLVAIPDVNGDGVEDFVMASQDSTSSHNGILLVISGKGLLDGYQPATDIIQTINDGHLGRDVQLMGNFDHDGTVDLMTWCGNPGSWRVYSAPMTVPEPASLGLLSVAAILLPRRRRREHAD